jgi:hypothetical protein
MFLCGALGWCKESSGTCSRLDGGRDGHGRRSRRLDRCQRLGMRGRSVVTRPSTDVNDAAAFATLTDRTAATASFNREPHVSTFCPHSAGHLRAFGQDLHRLSDHLTFAVVSIQNRHYAYCEFREG